MDQDPAEVRREMDAARRRLELTLGVLTDRLNLPRRAKLAARTGISRARARLSQAPAVAVAVVIAGGVAAAAATLVAVRGRGR